MVVKVDIFSDSFSRFIDGAVVLDVDIIVLQGSEESRDGNSIDRSPFAVHQSLDAIGF